MDYIKWYFKLVSILWQFKPLKFMALYVIMVQLPFITSQFVYVVNSRSITFIIQNFVPFSLSLHSTMSSVLVYKCYEEKNQFVSKELNLENLEKHLVSNNKELSLKFKTKFFFLISLMSFSLVSSCTLSGYNLKPLLYSLTAYKNVLIYMGTDLPIYIGNISLVFCLLIWFVDALLYSSFEAYVLILISKFEDQCQKLQTIAEGQDYLLPQDCQVETGRILKDLAAHHAFIIRKTREIQKIVDHMSIPYSITATVMGISLIVAYMFDDVFMVGLTFLQKMLIDVVYVQYLILYLYGGQSYENITETIFTLSYDLPWFTWDKANMRTLTIILPNAVLPLRFYITRELPINYVLLFKIMKMIYSTVIVVKNNMNYKN